MSLTSALLKGAQVDSTLDSLFKNSAGPAQAPPKAQEQVQPRKPKVTDVEEPKIKVKNPKPKSTTQSKKTKQQQQTKKQSAGSDESSEEEDIEEDSDLEEKTTTTKKKANKKGNVEERYEAKKAAEAKRTQQKKAEAPKETKELLKNQRKYDYGSEDDEDMTSKPEDLVHESLRNKKRSAATEDEEEATPNKKSKKDDEEDSDDEEQEEDNKTKDKKKDDPERRARTLFVGNLSVSVIAKADFKKLKQKFSEYGKIESIRFRSIAFSELLPRKVAFISGKLHPDRDVVNAYIVYKEKGSVAKAVSAMNGQLFLNKHLRVDTADGEKNYNPKKSVFVGNLAFDAQEEDLWQFFKDSGDIENVRIIRDAKTNLGKGFAYVQFQDRASVDLALRLHDTKMGSRKLRVMRCKKIIDEASKTNGMAVADRKKGGQAGDKKTGKDSHVVNEKPLTGAQRRLALKAKHSLKKGGNDVIVEGERATKGAKIDLGIKKGKTKVKANVPKKKKVPKKVAKK